MDSSGGPYATVASLESPPFQAGAELVNVGFRASVAATIKAGDIFRSHTSRRAQRQISAQPNETEGPTAENIIAPTTPPDHRASEGLDDDKPRVGLRNWAAHGIPARDHSRRAECVAHFSVLVLGRRHND